MKLYILIGLCALVSSMTVEDSLSRDNPGVAWNFRRFKTTKHSGKSSKAPNGVKGAKLSKSSKAPKLLKGSKSTKYPKESKSKSSKYKSSKTPKSSKAPKSKKAKGYKSETPELTEPELTVVVTRSISPCIDNATPASLDNTKNKKAFCDATLAAMVEQYGDDNVQNCAIETGLCSQNQLRGRGSMVSSEVVTVTAGILEGPVPTTDEISTTEISVMPVKVTASGIETVLDAIVVEADVVVTEVESVDELVDEVAEVFPGSFPDNWADTFIDEITESIDTAIEDIVDGGNRTSTRRILANNPQSEMTMVWEKIIDRLHVEEYKKADVKEVRTYAEPRVEAVTFPRVLHCAVRDGSTQWLITKRNNPDWEHREYSLANGLDYIQRNCPDSVEPYTSLIPTAFKADLLRVCILYTEGGVYIDDDIVVGSLTSITKDAHHSALLVQDRDIASHHGIWNAFIVALPKQEMFKCMMDSIADNVANRRVEFHGKKLHLHVSGPALLNDCVSSTADIEMRWRMLHVDKSIVNSNTGKVAMTHLNPVIVDPKHYTQNFEVDGVYKSNGNKLSSGRHFQSPETLNSDSTAVPPATEHYIAVSRPHEETIQDMSGLVTNDGVELETNSCALVIRHDGKVSWQSNAFRYDVNCRIILQNDGNLVIMVDEGNILFASGTSSIRTIRLDSDGILRGYNAHNIAVWLSHTTQSKDEKSSLAPQVAWLMSYPNSGTSYTLHLVKSTSNSAFATNYEIETHDYKRGNRGVQMKAPLISPFLISDGVNIPEKYILTKTHCSGFCSYNCPIHEYAVNESQFLQGCASIHEIEDGEMHIKTYDESIVPEKVIHLVRNPLDNIVSNFHHDQKEHGIDGESNKEDFMEFCSRYDSKFKNEVEFAREEVREQMEDIIPFLDGVPCHQHFFRYVNWHNNANAATKDKESLVIYYDEYITSIEMTLERISDFLDFEVIGEVNNFEMGKTYGEYFTNDQVVAILKLIRHLATPITMDLLSPYLEKMVA